MEQKNVVIYCRVSTKEQAEEGNSLVTQEKICREYANRCGFVISQIFIEFGESAKTANRTQLQKMLEYCSKKSHRICTVIVYKVDRLARNVDDYSDIRIRLRDYGVVIRSTSENFDGNPSGRFMENILANVAQFDNDVRTERSVNGMKEAVRSGRYIWLAPYGYVNSKVNGKSNLVCDPDKSNLIKRTFELFSSKGYSIEELRLKMLSEGLNVCKAQFHRILRNTLYCGIIKKFGEVHNGKFSPIITKELFELVQLVLRKPTRTITPYISQNPDFPLRRFVSNPQGLKLTGSWSKGKSGKKFPYYRFLNKGSNFSKPFFEDIFCEFMNSFAFDRKHLEKLREEIKEILSKNTASLQSQVEELKNDLILLKEKQTQLIQKNLNGIISDNILKDELQSIEEKTLELNKNIQNPIEINAQSFVELFKLIEPFLLFPGIYWKNSDFNLKLKLQVFQFPSGVLFDGEEFRTPKLSLFFKEKGPFETRKSHVAAHVSQIKNTVDIPNKLTLPKKHKQFIDLLTEFKEDVLDEKLQRVEPLWQLHHMTIKKRQREKDRAVARSRLSPEDTVLYREAWSGIPLRL